MKKLEKFMKKWDGLYFESSCYETDFFKAFATALKKALNEAAKESEMKLEEFSKGHFYISGFLKNHQGQYVYWSLSDVRPTANLRQVLYRTAKGPRDFTGGQNHYCSLDKLLSCAERLVKTS